jgi:RNA polymerase sigma-70 factor (ECF subfamily)
MHELFQDKLEVKQDLENLTDQEVVELVLKDKNYFDEIVRRYEKKLFGYLQRLLNFKRDDSLDALNETFLKIFLNLNGYNPSLKFSSWAYRIAHNEGVNLIKKNSGWLHFDLEFLELKKVNFDPHEKFLTREVIEKILDKLSFEEKDIISLFYLEGLSLEEIADIYKITQNNAKVKLFRARNNAKKISKMYVPN